MKKILAIILTVAMATAMLCSTAMAASMAPLYWDLEIELRKADPNDVIKDGVIGEKEYEKLELDNDLLWINWNTEIEGGFDKIKVEAEKLRNSLEYYFSWDEVHGFNFAVKYKPMGETNEFTTAFGGEAFLATPGGGLLFTAHYTDDPRVNTVDSTKNGNLVYAALGRNSATGEIVSCVYQNGWNEDYAVKEEEVFVGYDKDTGIMTYEWSIPMTAIVKEVKEGAQIYFNIAACTGEGKAQQEWGTLGKNHFSLNLGQWGFYMQQEACIGGKVTTATLSNVPVGYVEPDPTPEPTPEPTPTPTPAPTPAPTEKPADNGWMLYVIIIEAVAIVALVAVVVLKKKK